jgi:hypothetical protein
LVPLTLILPPRDKTNKQRFEVPFFQKCSSGDLVFQEHCHFEYSMVCITSHSKHKVRLQESRWLFLYWTVAVLSIRNRRRGLVLMSRERVDNIHGAVALRAHWLRFWPGIPLNIKALLQGPLRRIHQPRNRPSEEDSPATHPKYHKVRKPCSNVQIRLPEIHPCYRGTTTAGCNADIAENSECPMLQYDPARCQCDRPQSQCVN